MLYGILYGAERMIVEGLRTDSLYIGATSIRVSQLLSAIIVAVALAFFIFNMVRYKKDKLPARLTVEPGIRGKYLFRKDREVTENGTDH